MTCMKRILFVLFLAIAMMSCNNQEKERANILELEKNMVDGNGVLNAASADKLIEAYMNYAKKFPNDEMSPDFLFKAVDISVAYNALNPQKTIDITNVLIDNYPDFEMTPMAMFIKGFVYENQMNNYEKALDTYHQFLDKYPNNPMAADVQSTIKNIGIPLDELIKTFEQ